MSTPINYVEPINLDLLETINLDEEISNVFEQVDQIGKKSYTAAITVSIICSVVCTVGCVALIYKSFRKDSTLVGDKDKQKQADALVEQD